MSATPSPWDALAGQYQLHPGAAHSIVGQRPVLAAGRLAGLLRGQTGEQVERTLSSVFTLCAHAHRRAAKMALAAAQGLDARGCSTHAPVLLWLETARDHLRSIALDWPQRLPGSGFDAHAMDWLRDCPLPLGTAHPATDAAVAGQTLASLRLWLEQCVLRDDAQVWLARCRAPGPLAAWCTAQAWRVAPARCLAVWQPLAQRLTPAMRCLALLDDDLRQQSANMQELARTLAADPAFVQSPTWLGQCAETGAWSRLRHRHEVLPTPHSAWSRLSARWLELVEITAADPRATTHGNTSLLAFGALGVGPGQALAWVEMARGLLLHWVQLDAEGGVQDYRVLAPTEWNFHPQGSLARALAALPPGDVQAARTLAAAFDPCVACTV